MRADWDKAFAFVIGNEGRSVSTTKQDHGGVSKFGISSRDHPGVDVPNLTLDQAQAIYFSDYWKPSRAGEITSDRIATKYFDAYVNMGPKRAGTVLQEVLNFFIPGSCLIDGSVGAKTVLCTNDFTRQRPLDILPFILALGARMFNVYTKIIQADPSQAIFARGWSARCFRLPQMLAPTTVPPSV